MESHVTEGEKREEEAEEGREEEEEGKKRAKPRQMQGDNEYLRNGNSLVITRT